MKTIEKNTLFTNVGLTEDGDVWWEGMTKEKPKKLTDWLGKPWTPEMGSKASHGNARFCAPLDQCPKLDSDWRNPQGVPISAILFGGRRDRTIPLVLGSLDWTHGTLMGASISSEQTEAAEGRGVRHDPFAMLPFCGYNMGTYFNHWLEMGKKTTPDKLPRIFQVNWFRKDQNGKFVWPGFGENSRVLKWVFEVCDQKSGVSKETPVGLIPKEGTFDTTGLNVDSETMKSLFQINNEEWKKELDEVATYFKQFGKTLPMELSDKLESLKKKL
jgi:phosphoenolpyruvate carboxykinase (GTP)